jgi:two-component system sensor histidine kinase KdpD
MIGAVHATTGASPIGRKAPADDRARKAKSYAAAVLVIGLAASLAGAAFGRAELADVVMLYLLGVVVVALRFGQGPSLLAAILAVLSFDFFFVPPYLTFAVIDLRHIVTFAVMLFVAVVISTLTERARQNADAAREREARTSVLYDLSRDLARTGGKAATLSVAGRHLEYVFESSAALLLPDSSDRLQPAFESEGASDLRKDELGVAMRAFDSRLPAGIGTAVLAGGRGFYVPLIASRGSIGVLGLYPREAGRFDDYQQRQFAEAFASQIAAAVERASLSEETEKRRVEIEAERLRTALLSSVSHDLRTPLAVMTGAASTLLDPASETLLPSERRELLTTIYEEGDRLGRLIRNLLDITRLESGAVSPKKEWCPIEEIVVAALSRMEKKLGNRDVRVDIGPDLMAPVDFVLVEQLFVNVLENAAKYSGAASPIEIGARMEGTDLVVEVSDRGPGFSPDDELRVFEKFYRGPHDGAPSGAGLGLAIAKAIAVVHGASLTAGNRQGGGAVVALRVPIEGTPPPAPAEADERGQDG